MGARFRARPIYNAGWEYVTAAHEAGRLRHCMGISRGRVMLITGFLCHVRGAIPSTILNNKPQATQVVIMMMMMMGEMVCSTITPTVLRSSIPKVPIHFHPPGDVG